jgi:hypothetical protein
LLAAHAWRPRFESPKRQPVIQPVIDGEGAALKDLAELRYTY